MAVWKVQSEANELSEAVSDGKLHPVTSALLQSRGVTDEESIRRFFNPDYASDLHDPFLFVQMSKVTERIRKAKEDGERVGVFGDFDVDGVTSSALLRMVLGALDIPVSIYIPDKNTEGHGLHMNALDVFKADGVMLVMTTDCGMTNVKEVDAANKLGMDVIIIDHHHVPEVLPKAYAIINAQMTDSGYPFLGLCAVGTVFKVAQALYTTFLPENVEHLKWFLDVAAVGTVADCMPLIGENRVMVKYGLIVLSKTRRIGFQEMFTVGKIPIDENHVPDSRTIGFQIAPRINAAGRMAHAQAAHELLMCEDRAMARGLALEIEANNVARQKISTQTTDQVRKVAEEMYADKKFIFAVSEHYPLGIVGLVAGRIAHELNRPTAVFQKGEHESQGSFRSIPSVNIIDAIEECGELLVKFGGHSQAAGLTIKNENLEAFYEKLNGIIEKKLEGIVVEPEILIDMKLSPFQITPQLVSEIMKMMPFGEGNREPVFLLEDMIVQSVRTVGNGEKHLKLVLRSDDAMQRVFDAIGFNLGTKFPDLAAGQKVDVVFQLEENTWNGKTTTQLKLIDMRMRD
ncbi:MAG: single-stranded-DNA-specific exonuclease RecJ [Candidatus Moranbacteria bacterium]|nr:single-stranded-DNA-specific exonuclease RecJ [Candidatus Moranbacteria bacterium]